MATSSSRTSFGIPETLTLRSSNETPETSSPKSNRISLLIRNKVCNPFATSVVSKLTLSLSKAVRHLRTLLNLVLTNSEARKLLSDFGIIGRDLLAKGAANVAERLRPDEERLAKVDHTVPQDQFVTEGGRVAGPGEKPVLDAKLPFDTTLKHDPDAPQPTVERRGEVRGVGDVVNSGRQQASEVRGAVDPHISDAKE